MRSFKMLSVLPALALLAALQGVATSASGGGAPTGVTKTGGTPVASFPTWNGSFASGGFTFPFSMVGTDPANGSATTTVPVVVIPLQTVFSNGVALDGTLDVASTVASPLFQPTTFATGTTQYGDAIERSSFWNSVSTVSPDWHVLLGQPRVLPTTTISVPQNQGHEYTGATTGLPVGVINDVWFTNQLDNLINAQHIDPGTLAIFLGHNIGTQTSKSPCCIIGAHYTQGPTSMKGRTSRNAGFNTFIFGSYMDPGVFYPDLESAFSIDIQNVDILSHEVAEWLNDPLITNAVPPWRIASGPATFYGCSDLLEVGDPLVGTSFNVTMPSGSTYQLQDEALLSWFARSATSTGYQGRYSYLGTFTAGSPAC